MTSSASSFIIKEISILERRNCLHFSIVKLDKKKPTGGKTAKFSRSIVLKYNRFREFRFSNIKDFSHNVKVAKIMKNCLNSQIEK